MPRSENMDSDEKIQAHLLSIWLGEKKLFSKSRECMFFLTNKNVMFVSKTEMTTNWWKPAVQRQIMLLMKNPEDTMLIHDGYSEKNLTIDLENEKNMVFPVGDVIDASAQEKTWGSVLSLKIRDGEKERKFELSIAKDWVTYPVRDPVKFLKVNWTPIIEYIKSKVEK